MRKSGFALQAKHLTGARSGRFGRAELSCGEGQRAIAGDEAMKSNAPWSVKGIDRDARETAKEAARREGMTVGEWLNHVILSAGDDNTDAGEVEGLGVREIAIAIEHISRRIARAEERSAETADTIARSLGGAVERLQRLERSKPAADAPEDLARRISALEDKASDRQRIEALRALEKAVAQVAIQFDSAHKTSVARIAETERQLAALDARIEAAPEAGVEPIAPYQPRFVE